MNIIPKLCVCGSAAAIRGEIHGIDIYVCSRCKIKRQIVQMTKNELAKWYEEKYHDGIYQHSFSHDLEIARIRLANYQIESESRLLDVGSGSGAFVIEAMKQGIDAWGCEVARNASRCNRVYNKPLEHNNFPTDSFDVVTMHDVLEHIVDPVGCLKEVNRVLKQGGRFLLDFPNFYSEAGKHHWKKTEHIWFLSASDVFGLLKDNGFEVDAVFNPIESKILFDCTKLMCERKKILVPPGIGDSYWSIVKMQSFIKQQGIGLPDVYACSTNSVKDRSFDFIQKFPFLNSAGYKKINKRSPVWREAYFEDGRTVFKDIEDCDYFIAYNGILRHGKHLEYTDTDFECDWFPPMFESLEEKWYGTKFKQEHGNYFVAYFVPHGMYRDWLAEFNVNQIVTTLKLIARNSGRRIVLVGAKWDVNTLDREIMRDCQRDGFINLTGQTSLEQVFGLLKHCDGIIGFPCGLTMMGVVFRKQTLMLWNDYFVEPFFWNALSEKSHRSWYHVINTKHATIENVSSAFADATGFDFATPKEISSHDTKTTPKVLYGKKSSKRLTVACVLRSGGDFNSSYVEKLKNMVHRNLATNHDFICLSDMDISCDRIELTENWPGWWSKIELFKSGLFDGKVLYFDLDTVIVDDITPLSHYPHKFSMLHRFKTPQRRASGVMAWEGNYSSLFGTFKLNHRRIIEGHDFGGMDQKFIEDHVKHRYGSIKAIQEIISVCSFKHHASNGGPPKGVRIVCFHGKPRPHEVEKQWLAQNWK